VIFRHLYVKRALDGIGIVLIIVGVVEILVDSVLLLSEVMVIADGFSLVPMADGVREGCIVEVMFMNRGDVVCDIGVK
jgi:hypothetical protein